MYLRTSDIARPYRPRMDRKSVYKSVWQRHWRDFRRIYFNAEFAKDAEKGGIT